MYIVEVSDRREYLAYLRPNFLLIQRLFFVPHKLCHRLPCQKLFNEVEILRIIEKPKTLDDQIMIDLYIFDVELDLLAELFLFG